MEFYFSGLLTLSIVSVVSGTTWAQTKAECEKLHKAYEHTAEKQFYSDVLPRADASSPIDVTIGMEMYAIREFDPVNGAIEIVGSVSMTWTDPLETLDVNTAFDTTNVGSVLINYKKIWTPVIVLLNSADHIQRVGDDTYLARFNLSTGVVTWKPRALLRASCTPNVKFFPFDEHVCEYVFVPWFQDGSKVRLLSTSGEWGLSNYKDNGIWKKKSTSSAVTESGGYYFATFTLRFARQPMFFVINVMFPVLLLSVLSGFLFLLPAASGERVGFGITCFLSFVVLLQTMMQFFPEISEPMSLLCVYALVMMIFSGVLSIVNILLLKLFHKTPDQPMPQFLARLLEIITCKKREQTIEDQSGKQSDKMSTGSYIDGSKTGRDDAVEETQNDWPSVVKVLDTFFILMFSGVQLVFSVVFLAPILSKA